ncbi:MAG: TlpA family protein disulfide reductase [Caldilineaceae bacterium]|nr:TlpA family protein disulfide reductase [Caldilineaceae bacterium]MCB9140177.1 TlpA family protein disulfide reductase [Caldilineaceae bacterium]
MTEMTRLDEQPAVSHAPAEDVLTPEKAAHQRRMAMWRLIIVGVLLAFVAFLVLGLQRQNVSQQRASGMAPDFEFTTFDGEAISLADLAGQGVVLNFWASWCDPCRAEADLLEQTWRREQNNGITFIGLDYLDQEHAALKYMAEYDITYPNGADIQSQAARSYGIKGVPETFFISPDGKIQSQVIGPIVSQADLDRRLDEIRP